MHKDEIKGAAKTAAGGIERAAGRATGDERLEAEGAVDQAAGRVQRSFGKAKESVRKILKS